MASSDKALGKFSSALTLVLLAGILAVPFLPLRHIERKSSIPQSMSEQPAAPSKRKDADAGAKREASRPDGTPAAKTKTDGEAQAKTDTETETEQLVEWSDQEQASALRSCVKLLAPLTVEVEMDEPMRKGQCGSAAPVLLHSIGGAGKVTFKPAPQMNCRLAAALARWVEVVLQPAAREVLGSRITHIVGASSYACRNIYNLPDRALSEHATGNAIDISAFSTADGRMIRVLRGWGPTERDIVAARKKREQAKRAEAAGKTTSKEDKTAGDEAKSKDGSKNGVQKARLEAAAKGKGKAVEIVKATGTLSAAKTAESAFLKRLHHGACGVFTTVLGPEANEAHRNHFHFDMKARKSSRRYCH